MKIQSLDSLCIDVVAEDTVGYDMPYLGQHGISLLLTARGEGGCRRVLVDVAQDPDALLENMRRMQIQPSDIEALVLTHCHYDHTRGAAKMVAAVGRQNLPVVAHPDLFRPHFIMDPGLESIGMAPEDSPQEIRKAGGCLLLSRDPLTLMPGLTTTGEVPRQTDFEIFAMPLFTLVDGRLTPDTMADDLSVVAHVAGRGVVVITGCSHAGIVNICRHALDLAGGAPLCGIIGGFHLLDADPERIGRTAAALKELDPDWIIAGHCTGFGAQASLACHFKDRFSPMHTGLRVDVGAA